MLTSRFLTHRVSSTGLRLVLIAPLMALGLSLSGIAEAQPITLKKVKPLWTFAPTKGFVDDAIAFDTKGDRVAYIHTDSATFLRIEVVNAQDGKRILEIPVPGVTKVPAALRFSTDGSRLIFLWANAQTGKQGVQIFDLTKKGKALKKVEGISKITVANGGGQQALSFVEEKMDKKGNTRLSVALHRISDLRRLKRVALKVGADNRIKRPPLRVLYWERGNLNLVGMRKGKYDRKRDVRLPDIAVRWNLLKKKQVWAQEPPDLVIWTRALSFRNAHAGQNRFVHVGEALKTLYLVSHENQLKPVTLPVKWRLYETRSLVQQETWDAKTLYFSMSIDPVNPDAVARKKADKERMDLYRVDATGAIKPLGRIFTLKRRFTWAVGPGHFAYLRKLKGFGRGGKSLEVHAFGAGL